MVPSGWERQSLSKVAEIRTGVAKGKKGLKDPIEVPYLRVANVQDGHLNLNEIKTIQIERHQLERYSLQVGDVLMTEGGDFDKLGRGDVWAGQISPCLNQNHVFAVRTDKSKLLPYFLATLASSNYGKTYFLSCAKRSTNLASINSTQLKEFPIPLPPLPEQRKIAQILSIWDKAISVTEALIANSQQQKKSLMQQLLTGKKCLLDDSGKPFEGKWEEVRLQEYIESFTNGYAFSATNYKSNGIPIITMGNIGLDGSFNERISKQNYWVKDSSLDKYLVSKGDLLIAMTDVTPNKNLIGRMAIVNIDKDYYLNQRVGLIKLKPSIDATFLRYLSNHLEWRKYSIAVSASGVQANMSTKDIKSGKLKLPNFKEQQKIASVLTAADQEIDTLQQKCNHLKQEKKALMQQLLTGKRRVNV